VTPTPNFSVPSFPHYDTPPVTDTETPPAEEEKVELEYANVQRTLPIQERPFTQKTEPRTAPGVQKHNSIQVVKKQTEQPESQKQEELKHVYENGVDYTQFSNKIKDFLNKVAGYGIQLRVTSGKRAKDGGDFSHH
jgi:hypothetical protein